MGGAEDTGFAAHPVSPAATVAARPTAAAPARMASVALRASIDPYLQLRARMGSTLEAPATGRWIRERVTAPGWQGGGGADSGAIGDDDNAARRDAGTREPSSPVAGAAWRPRLADGRSYGGTGRQRAPGRRDARPSGAGDRPVHRLVRGLRPGGRAGGGGGLLLVLLRRLPGAGQGAGLRGAGRGPGRLGAGRAEDRPVGRAPAVRPVPAVRDRGGVVVARGGLRAPGRLAGAGRGALPPGDRGRRGRGARRGLRGDRGHPRGQVQRPDVHAGACSGTG